MSELLIELFSEEMPPNLQISARTQFKKLLNEEISSLNLKYKIFEVYSTPTRLTVFISGLPNKIKILPSEIKGPKLGVPQNVIENFAKSKNINVEDLYKKELEKGTFYFAKIKGKEINTEDELAKIILKSLNGISWKKSMKWSNYELSWGRPLRFILSVFKSSVFFVFDGICLDLFVRLFPIASHIRLPFLQEIEGFEPLSNLIRIILLVLLHSCKFL